jgi:hypothetical protein
MGLSGVHHEPGALLSGKNSGTHRTGGRVLRRAGRDILEKIKISSPDGIQTPERPVRRLVGIRLRCPGSGAGTRFSVCFGVGITTL